MIRSEVLDEDERLDLFILDASRKLSDEPETERALDQLFSEFLQQIGGQTGSDPTLDFWEGWHLASVNTISLIQELASNHTDSPKFQDDLLLAASSVASIDVRLIAHIRFVQLAVNTALGVMDDLDNGLLG